MLCITRSSGAGIWWCLRLALFVGLVSAAMPDAPGWAFPVLGILSVLNLVCAIGLFQWKKWGFYGVCVSSVIAVVVNLAIGLPPASALFGLVGIAILYGILQIGQENKGWTQLD